MKRFIPLLLILAITLSSCGGLKEEITTSDTVIAGNVKFEKIIGAWIYYNEIEDLVKTSADENEFNANVEKSVSLLAEYGVNTVILHTRAFDDAFYKSELFPVSKYCSDSKGSLRFDVLKVFCNICHKKNIKIWAWVNPYRINKIDDVSQIKEGFFQYDALNSETEQILIRSSNGVYYNPADQNVKKHIIDGIREILDNYDIDGIHFDDYFYPRTDNDFDSKYYENYIENGGKLSIADFRRENINSLISSVYNLVHKYNKVFSVSPASDIEKNYNSYFADVKLWAESECYVDYIIPQIYFGFENSAQPFEKTLQNWVKITGDSEKLLVGLALYKSGTEEKYSKSGKDEWMSRAVISKEIDYICKNFEKIGFVYYSASYLYKSSDEGITIEKDNIKSVIRSYFPSSVT